MKRARPRPSRQRSQLSDPSSASISVSSPLACNLTVSVPPPMHLPPTKTRGTVRAPVRSARRPWISSPSSRSSSSTARNSAPALDKASFAFWQKGHQVFEKITTPFSAIHRSTSAAAPAPAALRAGRHGRRAPSPRGRPTRQAAKAPNAKREDGKASPVLTPPPQPCGSKGATPAGAPPPKPRPVHTGPGSRVGAAAEASMALGGGLERLPAVT
mmetsp:Transcript_8549/g.24007  ORF Transcript_8549/g.24007 Transcript_8549/m.24007 type:complete len:214 (+) Transcript_8549:43-684(+)